MKFRGFRFFTWECRSFVLALGSVTMGTKRVLDRISYVNKVMFCFYGRYIRAIRRGI